MFSYCFLSLVYLEQLYIFYGAVICYRILYDGGPPILTITHYQSPYPMERLVGNVPIAKGNIYIENPLNPSDRLKAEILQLEEEQQNKSTTAKTERIARNIEEKRRFDESESI